MIYDIGQTTSLMSSERLNKGYFSGRSALLALTVSVIDQLPSTRRIDRRKIRPSSRAKPIASRRVTALADRYTGRHIHHARHTAAAYRNRSRLTPRRLNLVPAA